MPEFPDFLQPSTTSIPVIESGLFISTALYGIRRQRYLVLPLILAALTKGYVGGNPIPSVENVIQFANKGTDFLKIAPHSTDTKSKTKETSQD